jgi:hypothetical protein
MSRKSKEVQEAQEAKFQQQMYRINVITTLQQITTVSRELRT